ncbi:arginase family protein [Vibrio sp. Isolate25]|uniref:arginase family protein n=1 Tax=Vibrio sp. Isolate25 TaxID=2908535 RepID=UPI001EFE8E25|nr:arginase family protein [Vibrio sp. Isolate25]MCG9596353.1 arginase family protein [Vibrio sp. Isolate25]
MFGLFRRHQSIPALIAPQCLTLASVSEYLKPMSKIDFEVADQNLEEMFEWMCQESGYPWQHGGHFNLQGAVDDYVLWLSQVMDSQCLPVVLSNNSETLLYSLPLLQSTEKSFGIIHIGRDFELNPDLGVQRGSVYHFALSRYAQCRVFFLGIAEQSHNDKVCEYAEDLGCDWLTLPECSFGHRFQVKQQIASFLSHCDDLIICLDLDCLYPPSHLDTGHTLEVTMVNRILRQVLISSQVRCIHLTGYKDKHLYSKETQSILRQLAGLYPSSPLVA